MSAVNSVAKVIFGFALIVLGAVLGVWAGIWWAFIGGIIQIVHAFQISPASAFDIAEGIARIVFSGGIGILSAMGLVVPGLVIMKSA